MPTTLNELIPPFSKQVELNAVNVILGHCPLDEQYKVQMVSIYAHLDISLLKNKNQISLN